MVARPYHTASEQHPYWLPNTERVVTAAAETDEVGLTRRAAPDNRQRSEQT